MQPRGDLVPVHLDARMGGLQRGRGDDAGKSHHLQLCDDLVYQSGHDCAFMVEPPVVSFGRNSPVFDVPRASNLSCMGVFLCKSVELREWSGAR
jgi:hypothetical protein